MIHLPLRWTRLPVYAALCGLTLAACSDDSGGGDGAGPADAQIADTPDTGPLAPDMAIEAADAALPDAGPVEPVSIALIAPARGQRKSGGVMEVEGQVTGGQAPVLLIDGVETRTEADGHFTVSVPTAPGLNIVALQAVDGDPADPEADRDEERFSALFDADVDPSTPVKDAASLQVGPSGLNALGQVLAAYIEAQDLPTLLGERMPDGLILERFEYTDIEILLLPRDGYLELRFSLYGAQLDITGIAPVGGSEISIHGSASVDPATLSARLTVSRTAEGGLAFAIDGAEVEFNDFMYDIENVPSSVEDWFVDFIPDLAEGLLIDALDELVVPALFDGAALSRTLELLGRPITLTLGVQGATVAPIGLLLDLDGSVVADEIVREGLAVRAAPGQPVMQDPAHPGQIDLAVAADLLSRLLHAAWAAGILDLMLEEGGDIDVPVPLRLSLFRAALGEAAEGLDASQNIKLRLRPLLPPVARVEDGERPVVIELGDVMLDLMTVDDQVLVTVAGQVAARVSISLLPGGALEIAPDLAVEAWLDVAETPRGPVNAARLEDQLGALVDALPGLIADTTFNIGADVLPIPVTFPNAAIWADTEAPYVHLRADVAP